VNAIRLPAETVRRRERAAVKATRNKSGELRVKDAEQSVDGAGTMCGVDGGRA